jgi:alpha-tubulin suppressor-like RCC1 family protein
VRPPTALASLLATLAAGLSLAAGLAGCDDTLVDHRADPEVLSPPCPAGQVRCGGRCVVEDVGHCGATCADCAAGPSPGPDAAPVCTEAHACAVECRPGLLRSGDACQPAVSVSAGFGHACALAQGGGVLCWGANEHGQLGDGTLVDRAHPVPVALPAPATAIAAGFFHSCAVADGAVLCWGDNATGELGNGSQVSSPTPVRVSGIAGATVVAAGGGPSVGQRSEYGHTCALASGEVRCWGGNRWGQLGVGDLAERTSPGPAVALPGLASTLAVGDRHTCALVSGAAWCWGANELGQVGDGSGQDQAVPREAVAAGALAVAAGAFHTCAVVEDGAVAEVRCWGGNSDGQANAGSNAPASFATPHVVELGAAPEPARVAAGRAHTCVLAPGVADGATCFGQNSVSQLGGPPAAMGLALPDLPPATALAAGSAHGCALLADGGVACWGANDRGQLGRGAAGPSSGTPALVSGR